MCRLPAMTWALVMPGRTSLLPAGALLILMLVRAALLHPLPTPAAGLQVSAEEQRAVLSKRQGSTLSRRSILKSYHAQSGPTALQLPGVPNLRMAKGLPVFTVGSISVQGMRRWSTATVHKSFLSGCLLAQNGLQQGFSDLFDWVGSLYAQMETCSRMNRPASVSRLRYVAGPYTVLSGLHSAVLHLDMLII